LKDKVKINDFQELYKFFLSAKQGKTVFYISFGDPSDQAVADFQVCEVRYRPQATTKANSENVTLVLEAMRNQGFKFEVEAADQLRIEFVDEGLIHYFDIEVTAVNNSDLGLRFSAKLPENLCVKSHYEEVRLPAKRDRKINMTIKGQNVEVAYLSSDGASVFIPQANFNDIQVGKAIRHIELTVDGFIVKANAEIDHMRRHMDGRNIVTSLKFMFFGINDETTLASIVEQKSASLSSKDAMIRYAQPFEMAS
jgi:hypothetical protein